MAERSEPARATSTPADAPRRQALHALRLADACRAAVGGRGAGGAGRRLAAVPGRARRIPHRDRQAEAALRRRPAFVARALHRGRPQEPALYGDRRFRRAGRGHARAWSTSPVPRPTSPCRTGRGSPPRRARAPTLKDNEVLHLDGEVDLFHDTGFEMHTPSATVDLKNGTAAGDQPVRGHGPTGALNAAGFRILDGGKRILFTGKARLVLSPGGPARMTRRAPPVSRPRPLRCSPCCWGRIPPRRRSPCPARPMPRRRSRSPPTTASSGSRTRRPTWRAAMPAPPRAIPPSMPTC